MPVDDYRVAQYDQGVLWPQLIAQAQANGLCVALCAKWLKIRMAEMGSGTSGAQDRLTNLMREVVGNKALRRMNDAHGSMDSTLDVVRSYHLDRDGFSTMLPGVAKLVSDIVGTKRRNIIIIITCPRYNDGNHALAAYQSKGGRVHIFDPNEGEYVVPKGRLLTWFPDFLQEKYHGTERSIVEYYPVKSVG